MRSQSVRLFVSRFSVTALSLAALVALASIASCTGGAEYTPRITAADPATKRVISSGEIVGGPGSHGSLAWLGIPYAAPPVRNLRWKEPHAVAPWQGVRPALAYGAPCPQFPNIFGGINGKADVVGGSEDCLTLNVFTPKLSAETIAHGKRLPVMVWIHGGGNTIGASALYDGGHLATSGDVIVVTIQYRLGPFGWFRNAAIRTRATDDAERSGNFGTLDQIAALRWVRENIAAFGGDPTNVTIFGESAGGRDVYTLLLSPLAKDRCAILGAFTMWAGNFTKSDYRDRTECRDYPIKSILD